MSSEWKTWYHRHDNNLRNTLQPGGGPQIPRYYKFVGIRHFGPDLIKLDDGWKGTDRNYRKEMYMLLLFF